MLNEFEQLVYDALIMFGPSTLRDLQQHLDKRNFVKSQNDIEKVAESLVERKLIRPATGFNDIAYKV